jgi:hypothetical protein
MTIMMIAPSFLHCSGSVLTIRRDLESSVEGAKELLIVGEIFLDGKFVSSER